MKRLNLFSVFPAVFLMLVFFFAAGGGGWGCGLQQAGNDANNQNDTGVPSGGAESDAQNALALGNILDARTSFDQALATDPENKEAAFGAALTRLFLLGESSPAKKIMSDLGQKELKAADLVGPTSYLHEVNNRNTASLLLDNLPGTFYGAFLTGDYCNGRTLQGEFVGPDKSTFYMTLQVLQQTQTDQGLVKTFEMKAGDEIDINTSVPEARCLESGQAVGITVIAADGTTYTSRKTADQTGSGSVRIKSIGTAEGDPVEVELLNVRLLPFQEGANALTLNGSLADIVSLFNKPDVESFFPFADLPGKEFNFLLSKAADGLTPSDLQEQVQLLQPLVEEILYFLEKADKSDDFQFILPKGLYFGSRDMPLNRADLKVMRGGMDFFLAGLYLANSWECPMDIGSLYDTEGKLLIPKQQLVDELNECFVLKDEHQLTQAQRKFNDGFSNILAGFESINRLAKDGILENTEEATAGYRELQDAVGVVQASMTSNQLLEIFDPAFEINLSRFFSHPPDRREIEFDPFVLDEFGRIKPVEAFFNQAVQPWMNVDVGNLGAYDTAFKAVDHAFAKTVLDEFINLYVAGRRLNLFDD